MIEGTTRIQEIPHSRYFYARDGGSIASYILPEEHFKKYGRITVWDPNRKGGGRIIKAENLLVLYVTYDEVMLLLSFFNEDYEYWHTKLPSFRMEDYPEAFV